jgi:hypothetical protein
MGCRTSVYVLTVAAILGYTAVTSAEDSSMGKDLGATIALHGMPCDQVVDATRNKDSDYTATCKDGNRYHIFVDAAGRVVVQKV